MRLEVEVKNQSNNPEQQCLYWYFFPTKFNLISGSWASKILDSSSAQADDLLQEIKASFFLPPQ